MITLATNCWRWSDEIPKRLTPLHFNEPITDDLLLELNPEWSQIKESSSDQTKIDIMCAVLNYQTRLWQNLRPPELDRRSYFVGQRDLFALAACIGANPNYPESVRPALEKAVDYEDFQLVTYLLKKGADPNIESRYGRPIRLAKSIEMAELLIGHGAQIPENIIASCCWADKPLVMMQFYFNKGINPEANILSLRPLYEHDPVEPCGLRFLCRSKVHNPQFDRTQIQKIQLLLNKGFDLALRNQYSKSTAFHNAATVQCEAMCMVFINHYIEQHRGLLTFLIYLKKEFPYFYRHKDVRKLCLGRVRPFCQLVSVLNTKNPKNKTASGIWPIDALNPATCRYEKFAQPKAAVIDDERVVAQDDQVAALADGQLEEEKQDDSKRKCLIQ